MRTLARGKQEIKLPINTLTVNMLMRHEKGNKKIVLQQVDYEDLVHYAHLPNENVFAYSDARATIHFPKRMEKQTRFSISITTVVQL